MLCNQFRIASSGNGLARGYFFLHKIPPPTSSEYRDHSVRFSQSQGGLALHGYKAATLFWEQMTTTQAYNLRKRIQAALSDTGFLFMTLNRSNGAGANIDWIDVRGYPHMPNFTADGRIAGSSGVSIASVELVLNNITIINSPASFTPV